MIGGYFHRNEKDIFSNRFELFDSSIVRYKGNLFEIGGGYFAGLSQNNSVTINLYGGAAAGKFQIDDQGFDTGGNPYSRMHDASVIKFFLQPALHFFLSESVRMGFLYRFSLVNYGNIKTSYTPEEALYFGFNRIKNKTLTIGEPAFNIEAGVPTVKWIHVTGTVSFATNPLEEDRQLRVRGGCFSFGLDFDLSKLPLRQK